MCSTGTCQMNHSNVTVDVVLKFLFCGIILLDHTVPVILSTCCMHTKCCSQQKKLILSMGFFQLLLVGGALYSYKQLPSFWNYVTGTACGHAVWTSGVWTVLDTCRAGFRQLTHCRNKLQTEETVYFTPWLPASFSVGRFYARKISSAQLRNPPQCPSMSHANAHTRARTQAGVLFIHTVDLLISSLTRVTVYVTCVKTTSMDDTCTLQWHTAIYNTCPKACVHVRARTNAHVAARYCITIYPHTHNLHTHRHTHAARIDSKSCRASCHGH